jgi:hypothetical protein
MEQQNNQKQEVVKEKTYDNQHRRSSPPGHRLGRDYYDIGRYGRGIYRGLSCQKIYLPYHGCRKDVVKYQKEINARSN